MWIKKMKEEHRDAVLAMAKKFYRSDAVSHPVADEVLERTFTDAVREDFDRLEGYVIEEEGRAAGFCYVTSWYACETGGSCVMIEEIYLDESCRGKGYGTKLIEFLFKQYPEAKRFRLEVTKENEGAARLYERMGFEPIPYKQMAKDL